MTNDESMTNTKMPNNHCGTVRRSRRASVGVAPYWSFVIGHFLVASLAAAGCAERTSDMDRLSPRTALVAFHRAVVAKDFSAVEGSFAPANRSAVHSLLSAWNSYSIRTLQTAALIEQRLDLDAAQRLRARLAGQYDDLLPAPLTALCTTAASNGPA